MIVTEYVPAEKLGQFHDILCATGGRYLRDPVHLWQRVEVHYEPGDYAAQREAWERCVTPIREVRRDQWWRVALRRCGLRAYNGRGERHGAACRDGSAPAKC